MWQRRGLTVAAAGAAALAARYARGRARADREWRAVVAPRLSGLDEVTALSVLPLVERLTGRTGLRGEPGLSYLIRADDTTLLFDCGLGLGGGRSALASNAETLGAPLADLDAIVVSHLHADHVGGAGPQLRRTFTLAAEPLEPAGVPAYVPTQMRHARADLCLVDAPRVIARGVAVLPPLPRMLFWLGPIAEQALVVNVRGFGLVLVSGCGHPRIEQMLATAEQVLDVPIRAVVGGLHLPVHALGTRLVPQAVLGNPNWPWRPINEADAREVIAAIHERGPYVVALSGHDSTPWTYNAFGEAFGGRYRTMRVGEELRVDQTTAPT